jgi:hypothetical protein
MFLASRKQPFHKEVRGRSFVRGKGDWKKRLSMLWKNESNMVTIDIKDNEEKTWKEKGYKIGEGEWRGGHVKELGNFGNRRGGELCYQPQNFTLLEILDFNPKKVKNRRGRL